jgi:Tfp pilus assembly protein PilX
MFTRNRFSRRQKGSALVLAVLLMMVITSIGLGLMFVADLEKDIAVQDQRTRLAREVANSVLMTGKFELGQHLVDDNWSDSLVGKPLSAPTVQSALGADWLCYDITTLPTAIPARSVADESRGCLRATNEGQVNRGCDGKIKGVPVYDYDGDSTLSGNPGYLARTPYLNRAGAIMAYYTLWMRTIPNDTNQDLSVGGAGNFQEFNESGRILLIAEVWAKRFDESPDLPNPDGTTINPVVARAVFAEEIDKGQLKRFGYVGRNIDQHNTNTIYEF